MPQYEYCHDRKVWIKQCSHCNEVTLGTPDQVESLSIFSQMFADAGPSSGMADGFQSRCWMCNSAKRRELGVSRSVIERMMKEQDSCCAICSRVLSIARNALPVDKANVDHDNDSGEIRQLLCGNCNRGIGLFLHDPKLLHKAANYCADHAKVIKLKGFK